LIITASFGSILADAADAFFNLDERFLKTFGFFSSSLGG